MTATVPVQPTPIIPLIPNVPIMRLTVEQYHQMIAAGILGEDDPIELIEGLLVLKMGKNPPHSVATGLLDDALRSLLPGGWHVMTQDPVTLTESEPEPDVVVVRGQRRDYLDRHPSPADTPLVIEVADSTLVFDQTAKKQLYARSKIQSYWIVNLIDGQIELYTQPVPALAGHDYQQQATYHPGDQVPVVLDGKEVGRLAVVDLLP